MILPKAVPVPWAADILAADLRHPVLVELRLAQQARLPIHLAVADVTIGKVHITAARTVPASQSFSDHLQIASYSQVMTS